MEKKCDSSLNILDKSNILIQFNYIHAGLASYFISSIEGINIIDLCFGTLGRENTGKVREFLERKKVGTLSFEMLWNFLNQNNFVSGHKKVMVQTKAGMP